VVYAVSNLRPIFFSYAHAGEELDRAAQSCYEELTSILQGLVKPPDGTGMGFFDIAGLPGGTRWEPELVAALGHCQVLVALLSPPYLKSEWCGKEWHAFTMRDKVPRKENEQGQSVTTVENQDPIVPLRWAPVPFALPAEVTRSQMFRPKQTDTYKNLPQQYERFGLFGLMYQGEKGAVRAILWDLAVRIQEIYYSHELLPRHFKPNELKNVFDEKPAEQ
jgi:TIR domain